MYGVLAILTILVAGVALRAAWPNPWRLVEVAIYGVLALLLVRERQVRALFQWAPAAYAVPCLALVALCVMGQFADAPRRTYPFVNWTMYTNQTGTTPRVYDITLTLKSGAVVPLPLTGYPTSSRALLSRLLRLSHGARRDPRALSTLTQILGAIAARHHPDGTVRQATVWRCDIDMSPGRSANRVTRSVVVQVPLT